VCIHPLVKPSLGLLLLLFSSRSSSLLLLLVTLLSGGLKVLNKIGDVVVVFVASFATSSARLLLDCLVGLGELAERRERVRTELVEDAGDELGELLDVTSTIDGECVGRECSVD
jgi:hypothetical protein